jgi:hypothetical protein
MRHRFYASLALAVGIAVVTLSSSTIAGQTPSAGAKAAATKYSPPRTPDGHPDLSGIWENNDATPLERPKELEGRKYLTEAEVAALKKRAGVLFNGETDAAFGDSVFLAVLKDAKDFKSTDTQTGNYNHFWIVDRPFDDNRTSRISDPEDGRIPALTPAGEKWRAAAAEYRKAHPADGPEDLPLSHQCITFGAPRIGAGYNSYFQIVQTKDYVAIGQEMIHDVRMVPLDGRPHVDSSIRQWLGDSRGHWEGDSLVVDTTNFSPKSRFENLPAENLHTVERFTRIGPKTIQWDVTVNDPTIYTKPWTASMMLRSTPDQIFEMACHEGNEGLSGALSGTRALEKAAEIEAAKKGSR